jgi:hypothetical protein
MEKKQTIMRTTLLKLLFLFIGFGAMHSCEKSSDGGNMGNNSSTGKGGSMARFTILNNHLYTVDNQKLNVFSIAAADTPVFVKSLPVGFAIETIFARNNTLFLGSSNGMYIYDISSPTNPVSQSFFQHIYSCDPVVANDSLAYLTMRTETFCGRNTNELQIIDIKNRKNPRFVSRVQMVKPYGLGIDGNKLFVCDNGLKVFSLENPFAPKLTKSFNITAVDVIPDANLLMVLATDGLHQYKYQNDTITFLSHLQ